MSSFNIPPRQPRRLSAQPSAFGPSTIGTSRPGTPQPPPQQPPPQQGGGFSWTGSSPQITPIPGNMAFPPAPQPPSQQAGQAPSLLPANIRPAGPPQLHRPGGATGTDPWQEIANSQALSLGEELKGAQAATAGAGRQMANLNALAGRSVGGAFAGGAAQTAIGGMQMENQIRARNHMEGLKLRMAYLQNQQDLAERSKNRDLQEKIAAEQNALQREIAMLSGQIPDGGGTGGVVQQGTGGSSSYVSSAGNIGLTPSGNVGVPFTPGISTAEAQALEAQYGDNWIAEAMKKHPKQGGAFSGLSAPK